MRVGTRRRDQFRLESGLERAPGLQFGHQTLGLPDVQAFLDDAFGGELLLFLVGDAENDLGMADRQPALADIILDDWRQFQQPHGVGHHRAAFADLDRNFLLGELELPGQLLVTMRFLDGVEVFTLQVFDERQFQHRPVVGFAGDDGDFRQLQQLGGAPAAFAGNQFKKTASLADDERLHDALFADGIGQFAQGLGGKILARLERAGADAVQRHALHALAGIRRGCRGMTGDAAAGAGAGAGWVRTGLPPSNAPRPRPKAGFAMRAECRRKVRLSTRSRWSAGRPPTQISLDKSLMKCFNIKNQMKALLAAATVLYGAFITGNSVFAQTWTQTSAPLDSWWAVASSADGSKLVAVTVPFFAPTQGTIYLSTNSGISWVNSTLTKQWLSVASSADGIRLAVVPFNAVPFTSTNSGITWITNTAFGNDWHEVASSSDGLRLLGAGNVGKVAVSTNAGGTWTTSNVPVAAWSAVASSADGSKLVAAVDNGHIYTSVDFGVTWTTNNNAPALHWESIASSADGTILAAVWGGSSIFLSTNSGSIWFSNNVGGDFVAIALSADGTKMIAASAVGNIGKICTSADTGANWVSNSVPNTNAWRSVASSADGNKLVAVAGNGGIWISQTTPTPRLNLATSAGNLAFSWTVPSTNFGLQQKSDLTAADWVTVTDPPALNLTNLQDEVVLSPTNSSGFFRLISQ